MKNNDYGRGYSAGKKFIEKQIKPLKDEIIALKISNLSREDEVFLRCLDMALSKCDNWTIGKKKVDNAESYCQLAKAFKKAAISCMDK